MTLDDIIRHLRTINNRPAFDIWVSSNIDELTSFFYCLSNEDLIDLKFDSEFYFGVFTPSFVFKDFEVTRQYTEPFDGFLFLLASVAERLAENFGIASTIEHLLSYLPESPLRYRLAAVAALQDIDDIRSDYINLFPKVIRTLAKSESLQVENHTQEITSYLVYYLKKAEAKLTERRYIGELEQLKQLFRDNENINRYPFLGAIEVQELADGRFPHALLVEDATSQVLYPSFVIENLFKYSINQQVLEHPATQKLSFLMGYDKMTILNDVLLRGKTKFDERYKDLMPDDKVLLYCYFNMKKHFFTSLAVFRKIWHSLNTIFSKRNCNPIFIDIGCGPLTSGLALGQLYYDKKGEPLPINYIGIDISEAMIRKAREFSQIDFFNENTGFDFYKNWNDIPSDELQQLAGANNPFLLNASYLFANLNEDIIHDLAEFVTQLTNKYKNVHFIFQNPDRTDRNVTWELFKSKVNIKESYKGVEKIVYKTSRHSLNEPGSETVLYEIITFKP